MPLKQHIIRLTAGERVELEKESISTRRGILEKKRARILLGSDTTVSRELGGSMTDAELSKRYKSNPLTVSNVRRRAHERGLWSASSAPNKPIAARAVWMGRARPI